MQIHRRLQIICRLPKNIIFLRVIKQHRIPILARRLEIIQQRPHKPLLPCHTPRQLLRRLLRIMHAERRKGRKPLRILHDFGFEPVVRERGLRFGFRAVGDALAAGGAEGQDHEVDAVLVHLAEAVLVDVHELGGEAVAGADGDEFGGVVVGELFREGPAFFEGDFAEHCGGVVGFDGELSSEIIKKDLYFLFLDFGLCSNNRCVQSPAVGLQFPLAEVGELR